jgi:nucleoside-diphosphate-sugar epimerase
MNIKTKSIENVLVTGGASFISSHTIDALMIHKVLISVSTTSVAEPTKHELWLNNPNFAFIIYIKQ